VRRSPARLVTALTIAGATASVTFAAAPTRAASTTPAVTFGVPRVVDPIHVYGEPNMIVNPNGTVHASGPQGTGVQRSIWNISVDGGDSYRLAQVTSCPHQLVDVKCGAELVYDTSALGPSKSTAGPGGGDTELAADHYGHVYFNDLYALACFSASYTEDDGKTIYSNPVGCSNPGGDREWMALYDPLPSDRTVSPYKGKLPLLYMEYADQTAGDRVDYSTDGINYHFTDKAGEYADDGTHSPNHGVPLVDQRTGDFLGLTGNNGSRGLALAIGVPDATGHLTFHYQEAVSEDEMVGSPETLFPILTQDTARNLYAVWIDDKTYHAYYAWAPPGADNEWKHWSKPIRIDKPPANVNLFPWAKAGGPGILDVAWYGTDSTLAELGSNGPSAKKDQVWDVFFVQVDKATSAKPHAVQVKATPHPMHYNDICMLGTACITAQGNRNQADFFKLTIDPAGRAEIIYTDSSNRLSEANGTDTAADHQGAALDVVIRQRTGLNAWTGKPLAADDTTSPAAGVTDPKGDALFKVLGGKNVPGGDITELTTDYNGETLTIDVTTDGGSLADVATRGGTPYAHIVVRWQVGDTLYHAGVEQAAEAGAPTAFAGATKSVDLCSVSGCKPNYLDYRQFPAPGGEPGATVTTDGTGPTTYTIKVPASAIGDVPATALFESVMAFTAMSKQSTAVVLDNASAMADEVPLQIEGTRTYNFRMGATDILAPGKKAAQGPGTPGYGETPGRGPRQPTAPEPQARPEVPATGLPGYVPAAAVLAAGLALLLRRRARRARA
jgi:hypothetical protein